MNKSSACSKQEARRGDAVNAWRMSTHVVIWEKQAVRSGCVCRVRGYVCTSELGRCVRVLDFTNCMKKSGCVYMCGDDTHRMRGKQRYVYVGKWMCGLLVYMCLIDEEMGARLEDGTNACT